MVPAILHQPFFSTTTALTLLPTLPQERASCPRLSLQFFSQPLPQNTSASGCPFSASPETVPKSGSNSSSQYTLHFQMTGSFELGNSPHQLRSPALFPSEVLLFSPEFQIQTLISLSLLPILASSSFFVLQRHLDPSLPLTP